jgi:hypothetical protein
VPEIDWVEVAAFEGGPGAGTRPERIAHARKSAGDAELMVDAMDEPTSGAAFAPGAGALAAVWVWRRRVSGR